MTLQKKKNAISAVTGDCFHLKTENISAFTVTRLYAAQQCHRSSTGRVHSWLDKGHKNA